MKKNLSTRIKRNLSRIKSLCIFITDVYLSLDSEFIENYIESKSIIIMSDNRTIELHDNATYIENYGDGPKKKEEKAKAEEKFRPLPESLANPQGLMVLSSLAIHGFLDEHFQPKGLSVASNPQPIGFSGILLAKRQNSFYCTYFLHNRNVADTKSPYPIKRLEVIRWFNQKSMVFNQSLS